MEQKQVYSVEVSPEDYDIINRIASDYGVSARDVAAGLLAKGLKFSAFRIYATKGAAAAQMTYSDLMNGHKPAEA
jgi:hypothetical protein